MSYCYSRAMKLKKYLPAIAIVLVIIAAVIAYRYVSDLKRISSLGAGDEFIVTAAGNDGFALCGIDRITRKSDGLHIVTLNLCEDNIDTVSLEGDWFVVETTAGRTYRKNIRNGYEEIPACTSCPPGSLSKSPSSSF